MDPTEMKAVQAYCQSGADVPERESPLMANLYLLGEQVERFQKYVKVADSPPNPTPPMSEAVLRIQMLTATLDRTIEQMRWVLDTVEV